MGIWHSDRWEYYAKDFGKIGMNYHGYKAGAYNRWSNWMDSIEKLVDYDRAVAALGFHPSHHDSKEVFEVKCEKIAEFLNGGKVIG